MSKRKIISSLFLSATVLGGLLFTQTPTVKANEEGKVQIAHISPVFDPGELIQETNHTNFFKNSVSIDEFTHGDKGNEFKWKVKFDSTHWNFNHDKGGYYFVIPAGLNLKKLIDKQTGEDLLKNFPTKVNDSNNDSNHKYRHFKKGEEAYWDRDFDSQWGWSVGRASNDKINQWKNENAFSDIYYIDSPRHAGPVTYELEAEVTDQTKTSFPLVAVMKNFYARTSYLSEPTSLAGVDVKVEWPK
ncbi:translation initiation factor 2 [Streptococcus suis]|uniref:translation initiation factor 2 n=2 Tax=Streptococcus suis TaxID=1307 RepID=UPI000CF72067|nr:translation initiation factor 2 [Streptococcus suis]MBM7137260.1 translation initiation factor 2 [Streptococcus suis]MBM7284301.1 translation initiation factor 2 [Streptococcus suis]MBY4600372.1 translation initiation factor 2 [Streptococcus suis]MCO8171857.1 translation initiation factor 2 [Streptococcus suis]MCO8180583.1 translation initiation factor 2 [Streptococcus suis]